jgi:hypothetical protein
MTEGNMRWEKDDSFIEIESGVNDSGIEILIVTAWNLDKPLPVEFNRQFGASELKSLQNRLGNYAEREGLVPVSP